MIKALWFPKFKERRRNHRNQERDEISRINYGLDFYKIFYYVHARVKKNIFWVNVSIGRSFRWAKYAELLFYCNIRTLSWYFYTLPSVQGRYDEAVQSENILFRGNRLVVCPSLKLLTKFVCPFRVAVRRVDIFVWVQKAILLLKPETQSIKVSCSRFIFALYYEGGLKCISPTLCQRTPSAHIQ